MDKHIALNILHNTFTQDGIIKTVEGEETEYPISYEGNGHRSLPDTLSIEIANTLRDKGNIYITIEDKTGRYDYLLGLFTRVYSILEDIPHDKVVSMVRLREEDIGLCLSLPSIEGLAVYQLYPSTFDGVDHTTIMMIVSY